jgi:hypothetical protein
VDVITAFARASAGQRDLALREQLLAAGLAPSALRAAVATGDLLRVRRGVYARTALATPAAHLLSGGVVDPAFLRTAQAVLLELGPDAALCGRSAAVVWGLDMLVEPEQLEVQVGRGRSHVRLDDVRVRRTAAATQVVDGLRVTGVVGTLRGCAQTLPPIEAVAIVDSALRRRLVPASLPATGSLGRAIALADPCAGSVLESALRVLLAQHGLLPPYSQYVIRSRGRFVARVDFCWPACGLIVECDGRRWHDPEDAREFDRRRANSCASLGWRLLRFTWAEVLHDPEYVVTTVAAAIAGARAA